jgi:cytochrome c2
MTLESRKIFLAFFAAFAGAIVLLAGVNAFVRGLAPTDDDPWRNFQATARDAHEGRRIMERNGCLSCHAVDGFGATIGPELSGVTVRRHRDDLYQWIRSPSEIRPGTRMPTFDLSRDEILRIISYLESIDSPGDLQ